MPTSRPSGWPARWPTGTTPDLHGGRVCLPAVERAADAVAELHDVDLDTLTDAMLLDHTQTLVAMGQRLAAETVRSVAAVDRRGATESAAVLRTQAWLQHRTPLSVSQAHAVLRDAQALDALPALCQAVGEGRATVAHVRAVDTAVASLRPVLAVEQVAVAEQALVDAAATCDPRDLRGVAVELQHALAAEAVVADEVAVRELRHLTLTRTLYGMVHLEGMLDPESGAVVITALDALCQPDPVLAHATGGDAEGSVAPAPAEGRTPAQRRADALHDLARMALDGRATPTVHGQRPHVTVVVDLATLVAQGRAGSRPADLTWLGRVSGEAARRVCCDAGVSRVVTAGASLPLDIGRATRVVPPAIRQGLVLRDGGCVFPGCRRPPPWCDAHHLRHWAHGGPTSLDNLALLCSRHHHAVHEGGWRITLADDGRPRVQPPDPGDARSSPLTAA